MCHFEAQSLFRGQIHGSHSVAEARFLNRMQIPRKNGTRWFGLAAASASRLRPMACSLAPGIIFAVKSSNGPSNFRNQGPDLAFVCPVNPVFSGPDHESDSTA